MWIVLCFVAFSLAYSVEASCPPGVKRCEWFPWEPWGSCSKSCGGGWRERERSACCKVPVVFDQCMKDCNMDENDEWDYGSCNEICFHGNFHYSDKSSKYSYGRCICSKEYGGECCNTELCGWNGNWCWPGYCWYNNYEQDCKCDRGFRKEKVGGKTMCQLDKIPTLQTCMSGLETINGDAVNTTGTGKCSFEQSVYTNLQPYKLSFTIESSFNVSVSSDPSPNRIKEWIFGIVNSRIEVLKKDVKDKMQLISENDYNGGPECDNAFSDERPRQMTSCTGTLSPGQILNNGESICVNFIPHAGGHMATIDGHTENYTRTNTSRELCFMFDNQAPSHCEGSSSCNTKMLHINRRITSNPHVNVTFTSWTDPIPSGGSSSKASGIKKFVASFLRVEGLNQTLVMKYPGSSVTEVKPNETEVYFTLPTEPALYAILLEVHDVAGNVRMARRFVLYDNSSKVAILSKQLLKSTTASAKTNHTWQVHHGSTCLNWTGRYYNTYHTKINLLRKIKADGNIAGNYDQLDGLIPVSGTPNVDGIVRFEYTWKINNGTFKAYSAVSNIYAESFCENLSPKDGQTYTFKIKPVDINLRFLTENLVIHIDRSPPIIENIWLAKDGYKQLFIHNSSDLSKMSLQFEAFDFHSGLYSIEWKLGTSDGADDSGAGSIGVQRINGSCTGEKCYCPKVGLCEQFLYSINLNNLVDKRTNIGQHNRNYYFSIIVTNNAQLVNVEHTDVLADDSPPEEGVIQEGVARSPDVDYTSENDIPVNWNGFIDHESGIKFYRVGLSSKCLSSHELDGAHMSSKGLEVIETTEEKCRFKVDADGFYISSIVAYNNAMEPTKVVCSDGIIKDSTAPSIVNVTLRHGKVMEVFACDSYGPWLVRNDLKKVALLPTETCKNRCKSSRISLTKSLPEIIVNSTDNDVADHLCQNLPEVTENWFIYMPSFNIDISWMSLDANSQIRREEVGIASNPSGMSSPDIVNYRDIHGHTRYHNVHEGIDRGIPFYIMIRTTNKAGLENILPFGPIIIDDTPPKIKKDSLEIYVQNEDDTIYCTWDNETFIDPEQKHAVDYVLFKIGSGDRFFTPLLQIPPDQNCKRNDFQYCIHYPLSKLQRQDEEKSLQFYFELYIYNMAGHFTTARSPTFILPSQFKPGHGHVIDLDPSSINPAETEIYDVDKDCDVHFNVGNVCAAWIGFYHHRNVLIQVGVGTSEKKDDIILFTTVEDTNNFVCFNSSMLTPYRKYFITLNATCSGGSRVVSSNGITLIDRKPIEKVVSVNIGSVCESAHSYQLEKSEYQNNTIVNLNSAVPLEVGHGYTIESDHGLSLDNLESDDVLWMTASYLHGKVTRRGFRAFRPDVTFVISPESRPEYELLNMTLVDCLENVKTTNAKDFLQVSVSLHKNFSNFVSRYKASVFMDECPFDVEINSTCLEEISRTEIASTTALFQIRNISLLEGKSYRVGVSVCFKQNCLSPIYSSKIIVQSASPTTSKFVASVASSETNDTCLQVDMKWGKFSCVNELSLSEKYEWALSRNQNTEGLLTNWFLFENDNNTITDFELQRCVDIPGYLHRQLYACIRTMCESGSTATACILMQVPHPNSYKKQHLYELDANDPLVEDIKKNLQAEFLGDTLSLLHTLDLDHCRKDTLLVGAIPNSNERNITWYLLTDQTIPEYSCELSSNCVKQMSLAGGLVTLHKTRLIPGKKYYICARSNKTVINRELFNDTLEEINTCGNGFLIDDATPTAGQVTILNQYQGFLTSPTEMIISWSNFEDRLAPSDSNITSSIYSYSYAIGTFPGGIDVMPFKSAGLFNSVKVKDLRLQNGAKYSVTIRAWDHVNFSVDAISTPVGVDITPPTKGSVTVGSALRHKYVVSKQNLHVHWDGFKDDESGISHFFVGIGDEPSLDNILTFAEIKDQFADLSRISLKDGISYYAVLKAVNQAGLWTTVSSDQFILDSTPPAKGVVRDGSHLCSSDVDYQNFTSSLICHWEAFGDPHSGIAFYRVGLGTDPGQFDIHALTAVELRTEFTWHNNLKAGEKYFATVEACNGAGLCTSQHSDGVILDDSPPTPGKIHVGISSKHETYQSQRNSIAAHWVGFEDPHSDIHHFEWCITLEKNKCDIFPFTNVLLSQSVFHTRLDLPLKKEVYIKLKAYNNAGQYSEVISDSFRVDNTNPFIERQPHFALEDMQISHKANTQWENSLVRLEWKFSDPDSPVIKHIVRLVTHHDGKVRKEILHLGNEDRVTIKMLENDLLLDGDRYWATVTACNAAGLCTNSTSDDLLIDSSPPFLGGFKPPMTWENELNKSRVFLTWYGFSDIESGITNYIVSVSKTYSGSELSDGIISFEAKDTYEQNCSILLTEQLSAEDNIILTIWAISGVGLRSEIGKVTVTTVQTDTDGKRGILKLQKHSCITHYCNRDCTCAVVGQKCGNSGSNVTCVAINNESMYQNIHVLAGMLRHHQYLTASSSCLTFHWIPENNDTKVEIQRYEWSIGIDKPGDGVFVGPYTKKWFDVGLQTNMTFCMPDTLHLVHGEQYTVFIKAWYSESESRTFSSLPVTVDRTPPDIVLGKHIFISTDDCTSALFFINNASSISLCWQHVFKDSVSGIMKYYVMAGTSPYGDDLLQISDYGLQTKAIFERLQLHPGTKYFFTIRALNGVGLMTSLSSDGIVLDEEPPFAGVVFNTLNHKNERFQAHSNSFSASWHGFGDHHSYIRHYSVWLTETRTGRIVYMNDNVGIETSFVFNETNLQQNESYKISVKAWDAAGFVSDVIDSEISTIDLTPPSSFKCISFMNREHVCNSTLYTEEIHFEAPLQKDLFYKVIVDFSGFVYLPSVEVAIGHHVIVLPTAEKSDHSKVAELAILSPYNGTTSLSANFGKLLKNTTVCMRLLECAEMDFAYEKFPIDVMQISPSLLSVCLRILDLESGIKTVNVGVGTSQGGFQINPLSSVPVENHIVVEHSSPHGAELFVTAIAHNNAGLLAVFIGKKVVVDHTAPEILNVTAKISIYPDEVINSTYERLANITLMGSVLDKETGIKGCSCMLESRMSTAILALTGNINTFECVITDFPIVHGVTVQPSVTCTNDVELVARETGPHLLPSFLQPSAENADLQVLPYNDITYEGAESHQVLAETVQSNQTILQARWSGFHDASGIDHYEYILQEGNDIIKEYTEHGSRTAAVMRGLSLKDGRTYTLSVEAVNVGGMHSNRIFTSVKVESKEPEFSGRPVELNARTDGSISIEWKHVFVKADKMPIIFDVNVGSREGFCEIINRVETMDTFYVLPETEHSSLWLSLCARYVTGKARCHFQTLYSV